MQFKSIPKSDYKLDENTLNRWYTKTVVWHSKKKQEGLIEEVFNTKKFLVSWLTPPDVLITTTIQIDNPFLVFKRPDTKPIDIGDFSYFTGFTNKGGRGVYKRGFNSEEYWLLNPIEHELAPLQQKPYKNISALLLFYNLRTFTIDKNMIEKVFDKERIMGVVSKRTILSWTNLSNYPILYSGEGGRYRTICRTPNQVKELIKNG
jgi:hypothetical protein